MTALDGLPLGEMLRDEGLDRVEGHAREFVHRMRAVARVIARQTGKVSVVELREHATRWGLESPTPKAWGAIFRSGPEFEQIGYRKHTLPSAHARRVPVYRLRTQGP